MPLYNDVKRPFVHPVAGDNAARPADAGAGAPNVQAPAAGGGAASPDNFKAAEVKRADGAKPTQAELVAITTMKGLVASGQIKTSYDSAIGLNGPDKQADALKLFSALPKLTRANSAGDFVAYGLWANKPRHINDMYHSPRYLPGRQVLIDAHVNPDANDARGFMSFKADGPVLRTYRATLAGEQGDDFLVRVDGRADLLPVPKKDVFALNQPHKYTGDVVDFRRDVHADYDSPLLKAKIVEAALRVAPLVETMDFSKPDVLEKQKQVVATLYSVVDQKYPKPAVQQQPGRSTDYDAGRQLTRGIGSCFKQGGTFLALLNPFLPALGIDAEYVAGKTYTHLKTDPNADPFKGGEHGWLQLTYRPSMKAFVADPTWRKMNQTIDEAYSRAGRRYPWTFVTTSRPQELKDSDVSMKGGVSLPVEVRKFGVEGQSGREDHMENDD